MTWSLIVESLDHTSSGYEVRGVLTDGVSEKFVQSFITDGTLADVTARAQAVVQRRTVIEQKPELTIGMTIDVTPLTPVVVVERTPPSPEFLAWQAQWSTYLKLARWLTQGVPSVDQSRVDQAKAAHEKLWDAAFEALL